MESLVHRGLPRKDRLRGKNSISALLSEGKYLSSDFLRVCHLRTGSPSRIMVSVPKRHFKRAVKRNLLKRRIREAFRLSEYRSSVCEDIMFVYATPEIKDFSEICQAVDKALMSMAESNSGE